MKIIKLKGKIELISGMHIGGGDDTMKIGGVDKEVIKVYDKTLKREVPYIPATSLKGKIRSLLEIFNRFDVDSNPFSSKYIDAVDNQEKAKNFLKLFGDSNEDSELGITRAVFCDCYLTDEMKEKIKNKELNIKEVKYENSINRHTAKATNPRQIERVPMGVEFSFEIKIKVFDDDNEEEFKKIIEEGLNLLEDDYLGGSGSRGYGRVKIDYKWI